MRFFFLYIGFAVFLISCNEQKNNSDKKSTDAIETNKSKPLTGLEKEPMLNKTDSLQILYYDDPDGDSLRYTRFYHYISTSDTTVINSILFTLNSTFDESDKVKNSCRSEGKIILFSKEEPFKTLYFSTRSKDDCNYIYFIKDGMFCYFNLTEKLAAILKEQEKKSVRP